MRFSLKSLLLVTAIVAGVLGFWCCLVEPAKFAARESLCDSNLYKIRHALLQYESRYGSLPAAATMGPDGTPAHSWRTQISPFLDGQGLDTAAFLAKYNFEEPWDSKNNAASAIPVKDCRYACPCGRWGLSNHTNYVVVVGHNTLFPKGKRRAIANLPKHSDPILVIEIAGEGILWTEPRDLQIEDLASSLEGKGPGPTLSQQRHNGIHYITASGRYGTLEQSVTADKIIQMCQAGTAVE